jgi:hypothetical protein
MAAGNLVIPAYQSPLAATTAFLPQPLGDLYPFYSHLPRIIKRDGAIRGGVERGVPRCAFQASTEPGGSRTRYVPRGTFQPDTSQ